MSLQSRDLVDDATHRRLDERVNEACTEFIASFGEPPDPRELLYFIVGHSNNILDSKFLRDPIEVRKLLKNHGALKDMLSSALALPLQDRSYRDIRNLVILQRDILRVFPKDLYDRLALPFTGAYYGAAVDGFCEYLTENERLFRTTVNDPQYYAKFCSIVQSSGTGKTRMMTELGKKDVIVIYMSLREKTDEYSFPPRDEIPSRILTQFPLTLTEYRAGCYAFFIALFDTLNEYLNAENHTIDKGFITNWVGQMCDMSDLARNSTRRDFFQKVSERYDEIYLRYTSVMKKEAGRRTDIDEVTDGVEELSLAAKSEDPYYPNELFGAYEKMVESLSRIFDDGSYHPRVVIAVDEAHPLTTRYGQGEETYRPADVLCRIINEYSHRRKDCAVWVVFASTTSKVADFAPPNKKYNSDRVAIHGEKLFPPYTQLGWDHFASSLGGIRVEDVSKLGHIANYGRPLWTSLKIATGDPQMLVELASSKLCGGHSFDASNQKHALAVLGQRFGLQVTFGHPHSVEHLETGVASHLLICLATTVDRSWRFTSYPSEPFLSCVAAGDLHSEPRNLEIAMKTLLSAVNSGMIDKGQRGKLASRLLWLLAKDFFLRPDNSIPPMPSSWEDHLTDCKMIPVVDWLEFIFGERIWGNSNPEKYNGKEIQKAFKDAHLNFSHWVCMERSVGGSTDGKELDFFDWTLRHWQRTSAVQCCHSQHLVDKVIPIYFKGNGKSGSSDSLMSHIFISDKARVSSSSADLSYIVRRDSSLGGREGTLPYIAILADMGYTTRKSEFSVSFPVRGHGPHCLRIYAPGMNTTTYRFLEKYPVVMQELDHLVRFREIPNPGTPCREYLNAQVKFGVTSTPEHMEWERGKKVPPPAATVGDSSSK